jgi:hypothetical protein
MKDRWMRGCVDRRRNERMDGWMDGWVSGSNGWIHVGMDGWMGDGWVADR